VLSGRLAPELSQVDSSWTEPKGIPVGGWPAGSATLAAIDGDAEEVAEMEIDPEMVLAIDEPRFFNLPLGKPGTFSPPQPMTSRPPRASRRRIRTVGHKHDATSIVMPLPPPVARGSLGHMGSTPAQARPNWTTVGISAVAAGVAMMMMLVSPRGAESPMRRWVANAMATAAPLAPSATIADRPAELTAPSTPRAVTTAPLATDLAPKPVAPVASKPARGPTKISTKPFAPASKHPTRLALGAVTMQPASPAVKRSAPAAPKLATRPALIKKSPAASDVRTATRTPKPAPPIAAPPVTPAKRKTVASIDRLPVAPKQKPTTR
jgi:hypothetical protein